MDQLIKSVGADVIFSQWLGEFGEAVDSGSAEAVSGLFETDGYWKDMLSLSWDYELFSGGDEIRAGFARLSGGSGFGKIRPAVGRTPPSKCRRGGRDVVEGFFEFSTASGWGLGFVRLALEAGNEPRAWLLLTALYGLTSAPERIGDLRPSGDEFAKYMTTENWADRRAQEILYEDRDPEVIVIGAGQAALSLSARLKTMGVDVLLVDRSDRVGDSWRGRYHTLSLHNPTYGNHMPYMPFPEAWHKWLPKDKLADWLEAYAQSFELNIWTGTSVVSGSFDEQSKSWSVLVRRADGSERLMKCRQLVFSTGISGSIPNMPKFPGIETFRGEVLHSAQFASAKDYKGKKALVIGTGNSGHDIAQDLTVNGASRVVMAQRGPTCVVSLRPTAERVFAVYAGDAPVEEVDLITAVLPYPLLVDTYKWLVNRARVEDAALTESLNARGMKTYYGDDDTGFHMMYLRGQGGYYIDVGCSRLIAEGKVEIQNYDEIDCFVPEGARLKDGTILEFDLIVAATGFRNMQENIRQVLGDGIADSIGPVWGMDEKYLMRNMWRRTAQEGLWVMGGGLIEARMFSRMLALQVAASLRGDMQP